jgi:tetratricopeptide (TPR) repeat protein
VNEPRSILNRAALLERAGRLGEAEAAYREALSRWPELADTWYNLAHLQRRMGRFDAALMSYQQALERGVDQPEEVHLNRAVIYSDCLRQDEAAERELRTALAINPHYVPALLNLANLKEDLGERATAITLYDEILSLQPAYYEALARRAMLHVPADRNDAMILKLRSAITANDSSSADKAGLGFALGKLLDACGAYDEAFLAYDAANRSSRASAGPNFAGYDAARHTRLVDELIATSTAASTTSAVSDGAPVFICGMFRSGSTLAERILASHSRVTAGGELPFVPALVRNELQPFPLSMLDLSQSRLDMLARMYLRALGQLFPRTDLVTDKRPDNFLYIGLIKRLFPRARIVHTTRNPLDNCLSIFFLHVDHSMSYALDLADTAHYYSQYRRLMAHWQSLYGADILDLDYDTLVREPRAQIARLLEFCGLEWQDSCVEFHRTASAVKTASVWQVRESLYQRSSGRWRNYAQHLRAVEKHLRDAAAGHGS